jgi:ATPase family associated with various cellular activities (AAA)
VLATQNPIEMEGTSALPEAPPRPQFVQAGRALSGIRGAERKHFQLHQSAIFFSRIQFTALMPTDIIGANIIVEEGMAKSALRKHFQFQEAPILFSASLSLGGL